MRRAFTLTELLLAVAILAFALAGLLGLFLTCIFLNGANRNLTVATSHAQYALEEIKNTNFYSIQNATWDSATLSSKGLTALNNETVVITVSGLGTLDVKATVNWKDAGIRDRNLSLETLITEP